MMYNCIAYEVWHNAV